MPSPLIAGGGGDKPSLSPHACQNELKTNHKASKKQAKNLSKSQNKLKTSAKPCVLIVTSKKWNFKNYKILAKKCPKFNFHLMKDELDTAKIHALKPKWIFFPHFSHYIPEEIYAYYPCVGFHEANLPYGRGGSPLQNHIVRGLYHIHINAIAVEKGIDSGKIYLKRKFDLSKGSAEKLYKKASFIVFNEMIPYILEHSPKPKAQKGEAVVFKRRTSAQSELTSLKEPNLRQIYDFIRMLDAPSYPKAFICLDKFTLTLHKARLSKNKIKGRFIINEK